VLAQYAERRDELEEQCERDDHVSVLCRRTHTWPFEKLADADASARFQSQGEALFTPLRVRGNKPHRDPRGKTTKVADRRRGHHIAKAEGASRMYREVILKTKRCI